MLGDALNDPEIYGKIQDNHKCPAPKVRDNDPKKVEEQNAYEPATMGIAYITNDEVRKAFLTVLHILDGQRVGTIAMKLNRVSKLRVHGIIRIDLADTIYRTEESCESSHTYAASASQKKQRSPCGTFNSFMPDAMEMRTGFQTEDQWRIVLLVGSADWETVESSLSTLDLSTLKANVSVAISRTEKSNGSTSLGRRTGLNATVFGRKTRAADQGKN